MNAALPAAKAAAIAAPPAVKAAAAAPDHTAAWLEFWAKVIGAVAWPLAAIVLALIFAGPIRRILMRIVQFEGWGAKATFSEDVVRLAADSVEPADAPPSAFAPHADGEATDAASGDPALAPHVVAARRAAGRVLSIYRWADPRTTILEAWIQIETAIAYLYRQMNLPERLTPERAFNVLTRNGAIPEELARKITDARAIRNKVAHDPEIPNASDAAVYAQAAEQLADQIRDRAPPP